MAVYHTEFFGYFIYGQDLTYEELLSREEEFKLALQDILAGNEADFIHFEAAGDALRVQCAMKDTDEKVFQDICVKMTPYVQNGLEGRLLFVDKDLHVLCAYSLHERQWQEAVIAMPPPGLLEVHRPPLVSNQPRPAPDKRIPARKIKG
jgi:hypothetical protein